MLSQKNSGFLGGSRQLWWWKGSQLADKRNSQKDVKLEKEINMTLLNKNPPTWNFREQIPGEMLVDPIQEEFFTTDIIGGLSEALIRECIQNSLDAKSTSSEDPVRVRIGFFNEGSALVPNQYSVF